MAEFWEELQGTSLDGRFSLRRLLESSPDQAEYETGDGAVVTVMPAGRHDVEQLAEMQRACELQHPNLLRLLGAGRAEHNGQSLLYIAAEKAGPTLSTLRTLSSDERRSLERALQFALTYLHQHNLAYNNLVPATVTQVNGTWKLADYGSMTPLTPEAESADFAARDAILASNRWAQAPLAASAVAATAAASPAAADVLPVREEEVERPVSSFRLTPAVGWAAGLVAVLGLGVWAATHRATPKPETSTVVTPASYSERPSAFPTTQKAPVAAATPAPTRQQTASLSTTTPKPAPAPLKAVEPPTQPSAKRAVTTQNNSSVETGRASFFSEGMNGRNTASGEKVNAGELTAAHRSVPLGRSLKVTNVKNGKSVVVRVNDRGAYGHGQALVVSPRVARELGFLSAGSATVRVEPVNK